MKLNEIINLVNVAEELDNETLVTIGNNVYAAWEIDKVSREPWEKKTETAMNLALQVAEQKTFPWQGASNVKFPLVTIAALQYHARAYPALIPGPDIVKCRVYGEDPEGMKAARAERIGCHMSYQILEEDESWEENQDRVLIHQAIVGCAFKKTYYDPILGHNVSEHVLAKDLYIPYFAPSLEKASRITQVLYMQENDLYEKYNSGVFLDWNKDIKPQATQSSLLDDAKQKAQGVNAPVDDPSTPYELLEQHTFLDLDGDGYKEPYVITIRKDTKKVLRIVARFGSNSIKKKNGKIVKIEADQYFTKFPFIPSPDGGIYDLGFGVLLGPLNESINTSINQLIDAGTLSNTAGGFLGRGVKFRSGDNSFRPFEWKRVDSTGDDLRKGVFPLPVREPSPVLFNLLSLMIDYGERIGMAVDPLVGVNPGQNTPAETSRNMITEGMRIFSAIYKRTHRSLKHEFRKWYKLNSYYLDDSVEYYSGSNSQAQYVSRQDYMGSEKDIIPVSDPNMVSDEQKTNQAMLLASRAASTPGYNTYEVEKRVLSALKVPDIDKILPDPAGENAIKQGPSEKVVIEGMRLQIKQLEIQLQNKLAIAKLMAEAEVNRAQVIEYEALAAKHLAEANGVDAQDKINAVQTAINLIKARNDGITSAIKLMREIEKDTNDTGRMGGMEPQSGDSEVSEVPEESEPTD